MKIISVSSVSLDTSRPFVTCGPLALGIQVGLHSFPEMHSTSTLHIMEQMLSTKELMFSNYGAGEDS